MTPPLLLLGGPLLLGVAVALVGDLAVGALDGWSRRHVADVRAQILALGISAERLELGMRLWWLSMGGCFLVVWLVLDMLPLAFFVAFLIFKSARLVLQSWAEKRRIRLRDQMVTAARTLANQVRAGLSLLNAFEELGRTSPEPLGRELRVAAEMWTKRGGRLEDALQDLRQRLDIDSITLFVVTLLVGEKHGGEIPDILDRISHSLEELQRVERKRESDTASGRMVVFVLGVFPVCFLGLFYFLDPDSTNLVFTTAIGQCVLAAVGIMVYVSVLWARSLIAAIE